MKELCLILFEELQIPIINRIPDHKPLQDHNYYDIIIDNAGEKETLPCVSWKENVSDVEFYGNLENQKGSIVCYWWKIL